MKIILGSSSKTRKAVLEKAGYQFEILSPDIDEKAIRTDDYYKLPLLVARGKARALLGKIKGSALLISADQVVVCNGYLHEKPSSDEEEKLFLKRYTNYPAETVSAVIVTNTENGKCAEGIDIAKVFFDSIPDTVVDEYISSKQPFNHAGGFSPDHDLLKPYVKKIEGTTDSIFGLPMKLLEELLNKVRT